MLEHDVGILANQGTYVLAEPAPLLLVLSVLVAPEPVTGGLAIDDRVAPQFLEERRLLRARHHTNGDAAAVEHVLHRVAAESAGRAPDEHHVPLLHARAIAADEHAVRRGVAQRVYGGLLPCEVGRLGHELVGL